MTSAFKTFAVFGTLLVGGLAQADSPRPPLRPAPARYLGAYSALASGLRSDSHANSSGFTVRGQGSTQAKADQDTLARCRAIGQSCRLLK
ncbi:MAG: hypothetical protein ABIR96_03530 [Bdellovibrionota bacterium]